MSRLFLIICFIFLTNLSFSSEIDSCVRDASLKYNISPKIIQAIIKIESNGNVYAINVSGRSYYPKSRSEALDIIKANESKNFDVGIMQINKWWFDRFNYEYSYGLDPCFNIHLGSWILAYEISRHGYTWEAIGRYHSKTDKNKNEYIKKVAGLLTASQQE